MRERVKASTTLNSRKPLAATSLWRFIWTAMAELTRFTGKQGRARRAPQHTVSHRSRDPQFYAVEFIESTSAPEPSLESKITTVAR